MTQRMPTSARSSSASALEADRARHESAFAVRRGGFHGGLSRDAPGKVVGEPTAGWIIYTRNTRLMDGTILACRDRASRIATAPLMEMHRRPVDVTKRPIGESGASRCSAGQGGRGPAFARDQATSYSPSLGSGSGSFSASFGIPVASRCRSRLPWRRARASPRRRRKGSRSGAA